MAVLLIWDWRTEQRVIGHEPKVKGHLQPYQDITSYKAFITIKLIDGLCVNES